MFYSDTDANRRCSTGRPNTHTNLFVIIIVLSSGLRFLSPRIFVEAFALVFILLPLPRRSCLTGRSFSICFLESFLVCRSRRFPQRRYRHSLIDLRRGVDLALDQSIVLRRTDPHYSEVRTSFRPPADGTSHDRGAGQETCLDHECTSAL